MRRGTSMEVLEFLQRNPDKLWRVGQVASAIGATPAQVSSALHVIRDKWQVEGLERHIGTVKYSPPPSVVAQEPPDDTPLILEQLAVLDTGELLLRCEKGQLYAAKPLKTRL